MPSCAALFANSSNDIVGNLIRYMALPSIALLFVGIGSISLLRHSACAQAKAASKRFISLQFRVSLANTDSSVDTSMSTNPSDVRAISAYNKINKILGVRYIKTAIQFVHVIYLDLYTENYKMLQVQYGF